MTGSGDTVSGCAGELVSVEAVATCDDATRAKIRVIKAKQPTVTRKLGGIGEFGIVSIIRRSQQRLLSCLRGMVHRLESKLLALQVIFPRTRTGPLPPKPLSTGRFVPKVAPPDTTNIWDCLPLCLIFAA